MKIFHLKNYSFTAKIVLSFFIFIILFMLIRFVLIVPKIEQESLNNEIDNITSSLEIIKEQLNITSKAIIMQSDFEKKINQKKIENEILKIDLQSNRLSKENIIQLIRQNPIINNCAYKIEGLDFHYEKIDKTDLKKDIFSKNDTKIVHKWNKYNTTTKSWNFRTQSCNFFNYKLKNHNLLLSIACNRNSLNPNHLNFTKSLKKNINTNLLKDLTLKNTKVAVFWINPNIHKDENKVLLQKDKNIRKKFYSIGTPSNVENIPTGQLTIKEIFNARDQKPIEHTIKNKTVYTWITDLSIKSSPQNRDLFLAYTVDKDELSDKNRAKILFLLPEIFAIGISFIIILFLFRRVLKNINTLSKTAIKINQGDINTRSGVKGEDDIGILGQSFDSMLDFFQNNIKILDQKVKEKTKEIQKSLEEKEILLKEIHHRVKNNLALTISLLELQENDIEDEKTKKVLVDIQERIYTMELLHRKLYESENINEISFKNYVFDLIDAISKTYDMKQKVAKDIQIQQINLNIQTAMPYGLILNELITNAFKYAFNDTLNTQINYKLFIKIAKHKNDQLKIIVHDNGEGLKENFSKISNETLGLKLINMIVKFQLHGTIEYQYDNGAKFTIVGKINQLQFKQ